MWSWPYTSRCFDSNPLSPLRSRMGPSFFFRLLSISKAWAPFVQGAYVDGREWFWWPHETGSRDLGCFHCHSPLMLPLFTAATAKTILFFCVPHLKKGLQPNCRPWPCFVFPTCILLTLFSYGTYGACHQMRKRQIWRFWWKEQQ